MSTQHFVKTSQTDQTLTWTIDRANRGNALSPEIADELMRLTVSLAKDLDKWQKSPWKTKPPARLLLIRAESVDSKKGRIWVAGGDLQELAKIKDKDKGKQYAGVLGRFCDLLEHLPIPVIIVVEGAAIGGGAELAISGDLRIAAIDSVLDFRQMHLGLATGFGGTYRLMQLLGKAWSQRMLFLSEKIDAPQAAALGLFHFLASSDLEMKDAISLIQKHFLSIDPNVFATQKEMLRISGVALQTRTKELELFSKLWMSPVHKEKLKSWTERST